MTRLVHSNLTRAVETAALIHDALRSTSSPTPTTSATSPSPSSSQSPSAPAAPDEGIVADNGRDDDACPADNTTSPNPQASLRKLSSSPTPPVAPTGSLPVEEDPQLREGTPFMTEPMLSHWVLSDKVRVRYATYYAMELLDPQLIYIFLTFIITLLHNAQAYWTLAYRGCINIYNHSFV